MHRTLRAQLHLASTLVLALAACSRSAAPPRATPAAAGDALLPFAVEDVRYCSDIWSWNDDYMGTPLVGDVLDACGVALDASSLRVIGQMVRTDGSDQRCDQNQGGAVLPQHYWLELDESEDLDSPNQVVTVGRGHEVLWRLDEARIMRAIVDPTSGAAAILRYVGDLERELLWVSPGGRVVDSLRSIPGHSSVLRLYDVREGEVLFTVPEAGTERDDKPELILWRPTEGSLRIERIPTPSPPSAARLVGERILVFSGSLWVLSRGASQRPLAHWDPPPLESMGFVRLPVRDGLFVAEDGREWTATHAERARYVRGDQSVTISTSPANELANFSGDLEWATAALVRFVPWQRRWARFYRDHTGQRVVQAFTTGDDCAPSYARVMLRERGAVIEIWREDLDRDTQLRLHDVGYGPENVPTAAIPAIPGDAVEAPVEFGPEHRHCMSDGARPYAD